MRPLLLSICAVVIATGAALAADDWAETAGDDKDYAETKAICLNARSVKLPSIAKAGAAKDCDSSALLYGIGRPADAAAARACAAREATDNGDDPGVGYGTLATLYANGMGVPRDDEIAIAYACKINGAPAEMDGRIRHLARLRAAGPDKKPFDICDDVTSGVMEGYCAERDGEIANAKRNGEIARLTTNLDGPARAAFDALRRAEEAFVKASSDNEVDTSGTARGMLIVGSQQGHEDEFMTTLRAVLDGGTAIGADDGRADERLNTAYRKVMQLKDMSDLRTIDKNGIKETQRIWLSYRDAFVRFGNVAVPKMSAKALVARLTDARTKDLAALPPP